MLYAATWTRRTAGGASAYSGRRAASAASRKASWRAGSGCPPRICRGSSMASDFRVSTLLDIARELRLEPVLVPKPNVPAVRRSSSIRSAMRTRRPNAAGSPDARPRSASGSAPAGRHDHQLPGDYNLFSFDARVSRRSAPARAEPELHCGERRDHSRRSANAPRRTAVLREPAAGRGCAPAADRRAPTRHQSHAGLSVPARPRLGLARRRRHASIRRTHEPTAMTRDAGAATGRERPLRFSLAGVQPNSARAWSRTA